MKCLRVKDWNARFESAKSRTYKLKGQTYMPNKQGLGYMRLIRAADGPAMYGAWCAMVNMLSRMEGPRQGYLTDTGRDTGRILQGQDIAILTQFPADIVAKMIAFCASHDVGWLEHAEIKDTTRILHGPSPSPSPLPSPLPSPSQQQQAGERCGAGAVPEDTAGQVESIRRARPDWTLSAVDVENELRAMPTGPARAEVVRQYCADACNGDRPRNPIGMLRGYISRANAPAQSHRISAREADMQAARRIAEENPI